MVEAVLHNACLRLEDWGSSLDDVMRSRTRKRWFGRSGLVVGGAASLAVGAVLGGVLEGVPVLFPPTTGATSLPHVTSDAAGTIGKSSTGLTGYDQIPGSAQRATGSLAAGAAQEAQTSQISSGQGQAPSAGAAGAGATTPSGATSTPGSGSGASSGSGSGASSGSRGGNVSDTGTPSSIIPGAPVPAPQVEGSLGQVLNTLSGVASELPVVGQTASGAVGSAGSAAEQATGAASSATSSPAPSTTTTTPVSSASSPLPGITSGASSALGGL